MPAPRAKFPRRAAQWLATTALIAIAPKCALCVVGYAGLGAVIGFSGPEICGGSVDSHRAGAEWLVALGGGLGLTGLITSFRCLRSRC